MAEHTSPTPPPPPPPSPRPASPPAPLSAEAVRKIARLSRLALTDDEVQSEQRRLAAVLGYMDRLAELDLAGVEPLATPLGAGQPLSPDEPGPTLTTDDLMRMAPEKSEPFVKVPKVLGEGA